MLVLIVLSFSIQAQVTNTLVRPEFARWLPPVWFLGLCQTMSGDPDPVMQALAHRALAALGMAVVLVLVTYTISYRRHRALLVEGAAVPGKSRRWTGAVFDWLVPDPRRRGAFWEFNVRRPWGFDRGRTGDRWGPGYEGLVVARVDPGLLARIKGYQVTGMFRGPVRVLNAHPGLAEPPVPRYPWGRWQLDAAAFNLGPGEVAAGHDGPLRWEVLAVDASGRMKVRVRLAGKVYK